jgi:hypothetical protein
LPTAPLPPPGDGERNSDASVAKDLAAKKRKNA